MLLKTSRGLELFIHVPKTGGNTIQQALLAHGFSLDRPTHAGHQDGVDRFELRGPLTRSKHQSLEEYVEQCPDADSYPVSICVRDPFQRLVSLYFSPHRWFCFNPSTDTFELPHEVPFCEEAFAALVAESPAACDFLGDGRLPQCPTRSARIARKFKKLAICERLTVLRVENLAADFYAYFGFPLGVRSRNVSPFRAQARNVLSSVSMRLLVEQSHHQLDYQLFYS